MNQAQKQELIKFGMIVAGGMIGYKILFSGKSPQKAVKETVIDAPTDTVKDVAQTAERSYYKLKNYIGI